MWDLRCFRIPVHKSDVSYQYYDLLAEGPGVARGNKIEFFSL